MSVTYGEADEEVGIPGLPVAMCTRCDNVTLRRIGRAAKGDILQCPVCERRYLRDDPLPSRPSRTRRPTVNRHPGPAPQDDEGAFELYVAQELHKLRIREEARRRLRLEQAPPVELPALVVLSEFLEIEDEAVRYRVMSVWPVGGRVVVSAQFKAGKTTLTGNLTRSLVDGEPFLGQFAVDRPEGRVVIIDNELDERMLRRWLREQGIANSERVAVLALRGKVSTFNLLDPATLQHWAGQLRALDATVVIFDCLRPVLDALGLAEDKEAGRFLTAFDELLDKAGASEAVVVHHMGHSGERSRGDSRILDWPDVGWKLVRQDDDPASPRYFSAYGRDVDVAEGQLEYDPLMRRLTLSGGSRKEQVVEELAEQVMRAVTEDPGMTQNTLKANVPGDDKKVLLARDRAVAAGRIHLHDGPNRKKLHYPGEVGGVGCGVCTPPHLGGGWGGGVIEPPPPPPVSTPAPEVVSEDPPHPTALKDGQTEPCGGCGQLMTVIYPGQLWHATDPECERRYREREASR